MSPTSDNRSQELKYAHPDPDNLCAENGNEEDRKQHWGETNEIRNKTRKRHMIIWRADATGEL